MTANQTLGSRRRPALLDAWSMSATERMVMALQEVDGTATVGMPSNGSQATMILDDPDVLAAGTDEMLEVAIALPTP